jgi:hypothetical protein
VFLEVGDNGVVTPIGDASCPLKKDPYVHFTGRFSPNNTPAPTAPKGALWSVADCPQGFHGQAKSCAVFHGPGPWAIPAWATVTFTEGNKKLGTTLKLKLTETAQGGQLSVDDADTVSPDGGAQGGITEGGAAPDAGGSDGAAPPQGPANCAPPDPDPYKACRGDNFTMKKKAWCFAWTDAVGRLKKASPKYVLRDASFENWYSSPDHLFDRWLDVAAIFFTSDGQPVSPLPQIDENDTVVLVVLPVDDNAMVQELKILTCDAPLLLRITGTAQPTPNKLSHAAEKPVCDDGIRNMYAVTLAERCSSDKGIIATAKSNENASSSSLTIPTLAVYHLTVGLGFIYDGTHTVNFRTAAVKGQSVPIIVKDDAVTGLTPPILLISYRPFGVDTSRTRFERGGWMTMFGLSLGLSLTAPLDNIYFGALWEPYPGLGLIAGPHLQKAMSLGGGYNVGDRFPGGGTVPVDKAWSFNNSTRADRLDVVGPFIGISLDATLLAKLVKLFP